MFPLLLQTIITNQMRLQRLLGANLQINPLETRLQSPKFIAGFQLKSQGTKTTYNL